MAMIFTQTDSATGVCVDTTNGRICTVGGTAGSSAVSLSVAGDAAGETEHPFTCSVSDGTTRSTGEWTTRLSVTTSNMNLSIVRLSILRYNSSCVYQETIADLAVSISLGTTGVKTQAITAIGTGGADGDLLVIIYYIANGSMNSQSFSFTPSQNIDSPFTAAAVFIAKPSFIVRQAVNRASTY